MKPNLRKKPISDGGLNNNFTEDYLMQVQKETGLRNGWYVSQPGSMMFRFIV